MRLRRTNMRAEPYSRSRDGVAPALVPRRSSLLLPARRGVVSRLEGDLITIVLGEAWPHPGGFSRPSSKKESRGSAISVDLAHRVARLCRRELVIRRRHQLLDEPVFENASCRGNSAPPRQPPTSSQRPRRSLRTSRQPSRNRRLPKTTVARSVPPSRTPPCPSSPSHSKAFPSDVISGSAFVPGFFAVGSFVVDLEGFFAAEHRGPRQRSRWTVPLGSALAQAPTDSASTMAFATSHVRVFMCLLEDVGGAWGSASAGPDRLRSLRRAQTAAGGRSYHGAHDRHSVSRSIVLDPSRLLQESGQSSAVLLLQVAHLRRRVIASPDLTRSPGCNGLPSVIDRLETAALPLSSDRFEGTREADDVAAPL